MNRVGLKDYLLNHADENGRVLEKHVDFETKQRIEFDAEQGDDFGEVSKYLGEFFGSGASTNLKKSTRVGGTPSSSKAATVAMMVRAAESPSMRTSRKRSIHRLAGTVGTTSSPIVKSTKSGMKTDLCS